MLTRRIAFDGALLAFVASAAFGFWTAHDEAAFVSRFAVIVIGAVFALVVSQLRSRRTLDVAVAVVALTGAVLAVRFLLVNDWSSPMWIGRSDKLALLDGVFTLLASVTPYALAVAIEPDVIGGVAAVSMPLVVLKVITARAEQRSVALLAWSASAALLTLALLVSLSYGAWLALSVALALWASMRWSRRRMTPRGWAADRVRRVHMLVLAAIFGLGIAGYVALISIDGLRELPTIGSVARRASTWLTALPLAQDFFFTGLGLGNFSAAYPVYALLTWFIVSPRAYNVFADVVIDQGIIGLVSLATMYVICLIAGWRALRLADARETRVVETGLVSMTVLLINGLLNDPLYGSDAAGLGALLLFAPMTITLSAAELAVGTVPTSTVFRAYTAGLAALGVGTTALILMLLISPLAMTAFQVNLGAVEQARAELRIYDPVDFADPTLDQARQIADLTSATAHYQQALKLQPDNPIALQRLSQIAKSRGDYSLALSQAQLAWDAGHRDARTRMALGDALVANGSTDEAVTVVRGIGAAPYRFAGDGWYRYWATSDYQRAAHAYAAALALDPNNSELAMRKAEAEKLVRGSDE